MKGLVRQEDQKQRDREEREEREEKERRERRGRGRKRRGRGRKRDLRMIAEWNRGNGGKASKQGRAGQGRAGQGRRIWIIVDKAASRNTFRKEKKRRRYANKGWLGMRHNSFGCLQVDREGNMCIAFYANLVPRIE